MKIIHILPNLHTGGGEKFAIDLSNELNKNGHEVIICVLDKLAKDLNLLKMVNPNVKVISLNKTSSFSFKTMLNLYSFVKKEKPDVIHTHLRALIYSIFVILFTKIPVIHTIHNLANKEISKRFQKIHKIFFKYFGVIPVSISDTVRESTFNLYGKQFDKLVYNGVSPLQTTNKLEKVKKELENYNLTSNTKIILNIGRISKQKNQELLISTINELIEEGYDLFLIMIGSIENESDYYNKCFKLLKYKNRIKFLGEKNNVADYIYYSDFFCLSSLYEGLPLVVLEAMSMGKYVISTPAGGVVDVISDNISGYITKDFSKKELKDAFKENITISYDEKMIKNIFNKNYSMSICASNYLNIYKEF